MSSNKTEISELGTAFGIVFGALPGEFWSGEVTVPGIPEAQERLKWALANAGGSSDELDLAIENGAYFRERVLRYTPLRKITWVGRKRGKKRQWIPGDLVINDKLPVSVKFDSSTWFNLSPEALFVQLLDKESRESADDWYARIAPNEYRNYLRAVLDYLHNQGELVGVQTGAPQLLDLRDKQLLKQATKDWGRKQPLPVSDAYKPFCEAVSNNTIKQWKTSIANKGFESTQLMFLRLLRLGDTPWWLLGRRDCTPLRLRVCSLVEWGDRWRLEEFRPENKHCGQPRVDWIAIVKERWSESRMSLQGYCEIRWSHGKFQMPPECKVHITTHPWRLPGYEEL